MSPRPLTVFAPPKPPSEMTDAELEAFADLVLDHWAAELLFHGETFSVTSPAE